MFDYTGETCFEVLLSMFIEAQFRGVTEWYPEHLFTAILGMKVRTKHEKNSGIDQNNM